LSEDKHYYSVPYHYTGKQVEVIYSERNVEIYNNNIRIAFHKRDRRNNGYTTSESHMPENHKWIMQWNPERIINMACKVGDNVKKVVETVLNSKEHPEQGFKVCLGIIHLNKKYGNERLDKACSRAIYLKYFSLKGIKNILENNMENVIEEDLFANNLPIHENIRGNQYYN